MWLNLDLLATTAWAKNRVPRGTWALLMIMSLMFIAQMVYINEHKEIGAMLVYVPSHPSLLAAIGSLFMHDPRTLMHWLGNLVALATVGPAVEARIGTWRFLGLFFVCGIVGNLTGTLMYNDDIGVRGASAAIYGITAAFVVFWRRQGKIYSMLWLGNFPVPIPINLPAPVAVGFKVAREVWLVAFPFALDFSGHWLHLGGFTAGAFIALLYQFRILGKELAVPDMDQTDIPDALELLRWGWGKIAQRA